MTAARLTFTDELSDNNGWRVSILKAKQLDSPGLYTL